jgi:hypothetical protein
VTEFATPFKVWTRAYSESETVNGRGRPVESWADPVEQGVYGWSMPDSKEPKFVGPNRVTVTLELLVPESFQVGPYDKVIVPRYGELDVLGFAEDYNNGPFDWRPGFVVNLGRTDG